MELVRRDTGYGLRALVHMAAGPCSDAFTADELADAADTSVDFMHKIMQRLRDAGIVTSKPGPTGGFRLACDPHEISLLDAVTAIQGPFHANRCVIGLDVCDRSAECPLRPTWLRIQRELEEKLQGTTLKQVARAACGDEPMEEPEATR